MKEKEKLVGDTYIESCRVARRHMVSWYKSCGSRCRSNTCKGQVSAWC